jgi:transcriptional regulator with XRE-family HTH domain
MCNLFNVYICNTYVYIMKERILDFLKAENKSSSQFAEEIGVQPSGISHIISGRNKPSLDFILKMLEKYPFLSVEWLLFGKGAMYKDQSMQEFFNETNENEPKASFSEPGLFSGTAKQDIRKPAETAPLIKVSSDVEKIAWFYKNGTFREYFPTDD